MRSLIMLRLLCRHKRRAASLAFRYFESLGGHLVNLTHPRSVRHLYAGSGPRSRGRYDGRTCDNAPLRRTTSRLWLEGRSRRKFNRFIPCNARNFAKRPGRCVLTESSWFSCFRIIETPDVYEVLTFKRCFVHTCHCLKFQDYYLLFYTKGLEIIERK